MTFPFRYVAGYINSKPIEAKRALSKFFGNDPLPEPDDMEILQHYTEWVIFDFKLKNGRTSLIEYVLLNPDNLHKKPINQFKQIAETQNYSQYQILGVNRGEWVMLEDIFTGKLYKVYDKQGSQNIPEEGCIFARVAKVENRWCMVGANPITFPITYTDRMKKNLRKNYKKEDKITPKVAYELIRDSRKNEQKPIKKINKLELRQKRIDLEEEFNKNKIKYKFKMTFKELLDVIYNEDRTNVLDLWLGLGKKELTNKFVIEEMELLSDIWNYFPHKCLSGKSPTEMYQEVYR